MKPEEPEHVMKTIRNAEESLVLYSETRVFGGSCE